MSKIQTRRFPSSMTLTDIQNLARREGVRILRLHYARNGDRIVTWKAAA